MQAPRAFLAGGAGLLWLCACVSAGAVMKLSAPLCMVIIIHWFQFDILPSSSGILRDVFVSSLRALLLPALLSSASVAQPESQAQAVGQSDGKANAIPAVKLNGGLRFDSQGSGTPNVLSGYVFLPLTSDSSGSVAFVESYLNWNIAGNAIDSSFGTSTRLGYRWLTGDQSWIFGVNAGVDNRPVQAQNFLQAGVGLEALSPSLELRLNGYIPFSQTSTLYSTGYDGAYGLMNDRLQLNRSRWFGVALGGLDAELGVPLSRWNGGDLRLYAGYYYLDGDYVNSSSGARARAEIRVGENLSFGGTLSYDDIFQTQATGYVRLGFNPQQKPVDTTIREAEDLFLAQRGMPVDRQRVIQVANQQVRDIEAARNPLTGQQWIVRCVGSSVSPYIVQCGYGDLSAAINAIGAPADVLLLSSSSSSNLNGATLRLPAGIHLGGGSGAPVLATQAGPIALSTVFGSFNSDLPKVSNGIISIGSNTTIDGLNFSNVSITNHSTRDVVISNNYFVGSYSDNPTDLAAAQAFGAINVSANALPAIQFTGVDNLVIANNTFLYPQVQAYMSQAGTVATNQGAIMVPVCNQNNYNQRTGDAIGDGNKSGLCLSANAIRLNNSSNVAITGNTVTGALDEAFRVNNTRGQLLISGNTISDMRMGPDSNIGSAIIIGQNQGSSTVRIENNKILNNSVGVYPVVDLLVDGKQVVMPVAADGPLRLRKNAMDPIEVGLCRGSQSYPRAFDLYASSDFSGNCASASSMDLVVANNTISLKAPAPLGRNIFQDGDGIDLNIGFNAILNGRVYGNSIEALGLPTTKNIGDNGLTFDIRGNAKVNLSIIDNYIAHSGDATIGFSLQNTSENNQPGETVVTIANNTTLNAARTEFDLVNNVGFPVSSFSIFIDQFDPRVTGVPDGVKLSGFNAGNFPNFYVNGLPYSGPYVP